MKTISEIHRRITIGIMLSAILFFPLYLTAYNYPALEKQNNIRQGEFLIDTSIYYTNVNHNRLQPAIATDGENYLVVWSEDGDIYGTRVLPTGGVIDSTNILICDFNRSQYSPSVSFDGTNYFVVWHDYRNGSTNADIYGSRIDRNGHVLDPMGIPINTYASDQTNPKISFDGTNYLIVYYTRDIYVNPEFHALRINTDGIVLDTVEIIISSPRPYSEPSICFNGINYLIVWVSNEDIYGARVNPSGVIVDPNGIPISTRQTSQAEPKVAFDGLNFFVIWKENNIFGARVTANGDVLDPQGIQISNTSDGVHYADIGYGADEYLVTWMKKRPGTYYWDLYGSRVTSDGVVIDPSGFQLSWGTISEETFPPAVAYGSNQFFTTWADIRDNPNRDIYGTRILPSGTVLDSSGILLSQRPNIGVNSQSSPAAAYNGSNYLVAWYDQRNYCVYGLRIDSAGSILDTSTIPISNNRTGINPVVASDSSDYLIVYQGGDITGVRVSSTGTVADTGGIIIPRGWGWDYTHREPSVAFGTINYFVPWTRGWFYMQHPDLDIRGDLVHSNGTVTGDIHITDVYTYWETNPATAFDGTKFIVVWEDTRYNWEKEIYGGFVYPDGTYSGPIGICGFSGEPTNPAVTFGGDYYLVVWEDYRSGSNYDIYGRRVKTNGSPVLGGIPIAVVSGNQRSPVVAYDGTNYIVAWQDDRNGYWDIYGATVDTNGNVLSSYPICSQGKDQYAPNLSRGSNGQILATWSGWTDSINGVPANTMRIWGKFYPFTNIEETPAMIIKKPWLEVFPNPFYGNLNIRYVSESKEFCRVRIYDISGRMVKYFKLSNSTPLTWFGDDDKGRSLPPGVYFIRMETNDISQVKKIILLK